MRRRTPLPRVAEIVLDRPENLNALSAQTNAELAAAVDETLNDPQVRAIILSSDVEKAFGAGADLRERIGVDDEELLRIRYLSQSATQAFLDIPVPVVAALHGYSLGGALELALTCDILVAAEDAQIGLPETGIGITPGGGGTALILDRLPYGLACDMVFTGRRLTAEEALRVGLVDRIAPKGSARAVALDIAATIANRAPGATRLAKRSLRAARRRPVADALRHEDEAWREAALSAEYRAGLTAFVDKTSPPWEL